MTRRFQFSVRALLVLVLAAACFFGGVRVERERQRRQDAVALAARDAEHQAALVRANWRRALIARERNTQSQQIAAEAEARARVDRELLLQARKADQLMARFNALVGEASTHGQDPPHPATWTKLTQRRAVKPSAARQAEFEELDRAFRKLEGGR
jgi:hypothetical protein